MITNAKNNIFKPKQILNLSATTPSSNESFEPKTVSQALKISYWWQAMSEEFDDLVSNSTWTLVPPNPTQNIVGCKWIFRIKQNPDGSVMRYKLALLLKAFIKDPESISQTLLVQWSSQQQFESFFT